MPVTSPPALRKVALAGNPNAGKTTAFNAYTGARQHVGNYPGITVECKEGLANATGGERIRMLDLPGVYSLTVYSPEETVARSVLAMERPEVVIDLLNASALERNLYLVVQLLELGVPLALGLNMMDEAAREGVRIDVARLSARLGVPVVPTVARTGQGLQELLDAALAHGEQVAARDGAQVWTPLRLSYGPDLDPVLNAMEAELAANLPQEEYPHLPPALLPGAFPARWIALKLLEGDAEIRAQLRAAHPALCARLQGQVNAVAAHLYETLHSSPEAVIADYRYGFIASLLKDGVLIRESTHQDRLALSDQLDRVLTHRVAGPLILLGILYLIYQITFSLGALPMAWVESGFALLREGAEAALPEGLLKSLLISGVIDGVGGVMSFVPLILLIFLQIAILEDSGYMARMAYMLDQIFRFFGLHGCSVMPFIVGGGIAGGCAVPAVLATRTLRSPKEKLATLLTVPFMACGAKLPVFILFSGIFFPGHEASVMFGLTLAGWLTALLVARLLRSTLIRGASTPFVMELPPYRLPTLQGLLIHTVERTWEYLKKAGTVILSISILFWAAMTYPALPEADLAVFQARRAVLESALKAPHGEPATPDKVQAALVSLEQEQAQKALRHTLAGRIGIALEPFTLPAGFDWRTDVALLGGFAAKEVIVSTLGTAYSLGTLEAENPGPLADKIRSEGHWTQASALALLVFVLLYAPCFVTLAAIRQETGSWLWPCFSLLFNTLVAYGAALAVRQLGGLGFLFM